jgi:hypothetical protein
MGHRHLTYESWRPWRLIRGMAAPAGAPSFLQGSWDVGETIAFCRLYLRTSHTRRRLRSSAGKSHSSLACSARVSWTLCYNLHFNGGLHSSDIPVESGFPSIKYLTFRVKVSSCQKRLMNIAAHLKSLSRGNNANRDVGVVRCQGIKPA